MVEVDLKMPQYLYDFAVGHAAEANVTVDEYILKVLEEGAKRQMEDSGYKQPEP